jgi:hypothetical protein
MNEFLRKRIERKLETLPDERIYQVLDYLEFLESKYASRAEPSPTPLQRLAETVEDTLRAGRVSATTIKGTMDAMAAAGRVMSGLAAAGKAVVDQVAGGGADARERQEPKSAPKPEAPPSSETA